MMQLEWLQRRLSPKAPKKSRTKWQLSCRRQFMGPDAPKILFPEKCFSWKKLLAIRFLGKTAEYNEFHAEIVRCTRRRRIAIWSLLPLPYSRRPTLKAPDKPADRVAQALSATRSSCYETARVADTATRRPSLGSSFSHSPLKSSRSHWSTRHRLDAGGRLNAKPKAVGAPASCRLLGRVRSSRVPEGVGSCVAKYLGSFEVPSLTLRVCPL